jgi:putative phosphoribosyl transferase
VPLDGKTALIVDDGVATGATARAACRVARRLGAARVVLAVPVGPSGVGDRFRGEVDELVCPDQPEAFYAVGQFYADFGQTGDDEVTALLHRRAAEMASAAPTPVHQVDEEVGIDVAGVRLEGRLSVPEGARGVVLFAHGSGSSRHSPRNQYVAAVLQRAGVGTLLFDLLTTAEEHDRRLVFDVDLLAGRLSGATDWLRKQAGVADLPLGYFGASTGAAAALVAAAVLGDAVAAVVSRGGRPDLAGARLAEVRAPTLLVVGGADEVVLDLNRAAAGQLACPHELVVVPRATHLFPEPGALETVCSLASAWFVEHLGARAAVPTPSGAR